MLGQYNAVLKKRSLKGLYENRHFKSEIWLAIGFQHRKMHLICNLIVFYHFVSKELLVLEKQSI